MANDLHNAQLPGAGQSMSARTRFLAKLLGIYSILVSLSMLAHRQATILIVTQLLESSPLMLLTGVFTLIAGLAMVLGHNVYSGGVATVIVSLAGWSTLIKGALSVYLTPEEASAVFLGALHYEERFYVYAAFSLLLGAYLTYSGYSHRRTGPMNATVSDMAGDGMRNLSVMPAAF